MIRPKRLAVLLLTSLVLPQIIWAAGQEKQQQDRQLIYSDPGWGIKFEYPDDWHVQTSTYATLVRFTVSNVTKHSAISDESLSNESFFTLDIRLGMNTGRLSIKDWFDRSIIKPGNYDNPPKNVSQVELNGYPAIRFDKDGLVTTRSFFVARGIDLIEVSFEMHTPKFLPIYERVLASVRIDPDANAATRHRVVNPPQMHPVPDAKNAIPTQVTEYQTALRELRRGTGAESLETVYRLGIAAQLALANSDQLDGQTLDSISKIMEGFSVGRDDMGTHISRDLDFFGALAQRRGRPSDKLYFGLLKETYPDSIGSAKYTVLLTDGGDQCTLFGSKALTGLYGKWRGLQMNYPGSYKNEIAQELSNIERELTARAEACDGKDTVIDELSYFVAQFPNLSITDRVKQRLQAVRSGSSDMKFGCRDLAKCK